MHFKKDISKHTAIAMEVYSAHNFINTTEQTSLFQGFGGICALLHYAVDESMYATL